MIMWAGLRVTKDVAYSPLLYHGTSQVVTKVSIKHQEHEGEDEPLAK
jgi:hypothetical protein